MSDLEREVERLSELLVPYLCERTGLSHDQVTAVIEAQDMFWENQPSVIAQMVIFEMPDDENDRQRDGEGGWSQ